MIPEDVKVISELLDDARDPNYVDIIEFKTQLKLADELIAKAFDLNAKEWDYVQKRLSNPPFDVLTTRYPWKSVELRDIQEYTSDRFA